MYLPDSSAARLRIALNLKKIPHEYVYVDLLKDEHHSASYKKLNPSQSVPALVVPTGKDDESFCIGQSVAALEYLEEAYPDTPRLLPSISNFAARAAVRSLVQIIASDMQPLINLHIIRRIGKLGADADAWGRDLTTAGLSKYEAAIADTAGKYSYGDEMSIADCCIVPVVWGAQHYGVDTTPFTKTMQVYGRMMEEPAVEKAHWRNQEDTPEEFKK